MILRLTFHFEWHRGYNHNLPRISFKRPPSQGRKFYDKGWGWRRYVMCGPCSGVGYFDAPLNDDRAVIWPAGGELNRAADEIIGTRTVDHGDGVTEEEWVFASDEPLRGPVSVRNYRAADKDPRAANVTQRPLQLQEEGNGDRWENEGGRYYGDRDEFGRTPDALHYECPFPCHEFH